MIPNEPQDFPTVHDRPIGVILRDLGALSAADVEKVLGFQREQSLRFGEAAIRLGLVSSEAVLSALAEQYHYPVVTSDPRQVSAELVTLLAPFSARAEAFRATRSQILMRRKAAEASAALAVVGPGRGDGRSYFAANLAVVLAQLGERTLLVDADLRAPRQHEIFQLPNAEGLSTLLSGRAANQVMQGVAQVPGLFVLPAGPLPPNPTELVERSAFGLLVRELSAKFDHVVVDTASASQGSDAYVAASRCGSAVIVARRHSSSFAALGDMASALNIGSAHLLGTVLNEH